MWIVFALLASTFWGITYIFEEHVYKHISYVTSLAFTFLIGGIAFAIIAVMRGVFKADLVTLSSSRLTIFYLVLVIVGTLVAELCIGSAITRRNAEVASLIEITYPIFIAIFGLLFFRENNANLGTIFGGALIFAGVISIYFFNR